MQMREAIICMPLDAKLSNLLIAKIFQIRSIAFGKDWDILLVAVSKLIPIMCIRTLTQR